MHLPFSIFLGPAACTQRCCLSERTGL